jgi:HEAT repeat protein
MRYVKVKWLQDSPDYPVLLYSELDIQDWEVRKVEVYADGRMDFADHIERSGDTKLGIEPLPPLAEVAADREFEPFTITPEEFEKVWLEARGLQAAGRAPHS